MLTHTRADFVTNVARAGLAYAAIASFFVAAAASCGADDLELLDAAGNLPKTGPRNWALLIGVSAYEKATPLPSTANDVAQLFDVLRFRADYSDKSILVLADGADQKRDAAKRAPTHDNLIREIDKFMKLPEKGDKIFVYFSGHGFRGDDGALYLAPLDCDPKNPTAAGIKVQWVREQLAACHADFKLLVLDACHAGSEKSDEAGDSVASGELGAVFSGLEGVATIASSQASEKSLMWDEKQQSLFSYWLVQALKGHADRDNDGSISIDELYQYVSGQVSRTAQLRFGRAQTPVRIIRPGTAGVPEVAKLKPQTLKAVLNDMAEQLGWELQTNRIPSVGVVEFSGVSDNIELLRGDFGTIGRYCADELTARLTDLGVGRYSVVDTRRLHEVLAQQDFSLGDFASTKALNGVAKGVGEMPAIVHGTLRNRRGAIVYLRTEIVRTDDPTRPATAGGVAELSASEWAMLGKSAAARPEDHVARADPETGEQRSATATLVSNLDERATARHPMLSPDFPFRVRVMVGNKERTPKERGNDLYVPLAPGEVYTLWIDYRSIGSTDDQVVFMRLLVDGLNTMPRKVSTKGVDTWEWGQRENLAEAKHWILDPAKRREWAVKGFYTRYGSANDTYRDFKVVDAEQSLATRQRFTSDIGLITAAFYTRAADGRGDVGTDAGEERSEQVGLYRDGGQVGNLLGVVNLHYVSPQALQGL